MRPWVPLADAEAATYAHKTIYQGNPVTLGKSVWCFQKLAQPAMNSSGCHCMETHNSCDPVSDGLYRPVFTFNGLLSTFASAPIFKLTFAPVSLSIITVDML